MFSQPVSSPPPGLQSAGPVSPTRPSRLRGLSYLRNYTHNHLLSRDSHHQSSAAGTQGAAPRSQNHSASLTRSVSYTPSSSSSVASQTPARLTLANSHSPGASPPRSPRVAVVDAAAGDRTAPPAPSSPSSRAAPASSPTSDREAAPPSPSAPTSAQTAGTNGLPESASAPVAGITPAMPPASRLATDDATTDAASAAAAAASAAATTTASNPSTGNDALPSIRFTAYYDPRSTRPSLTFSPVSRTLANGSGAIRVGRYSERDGHAVNTNNNQLTASPVGFKSKVVSRRHCEFWCEDGKWFIKDVKSSSGTFLNHIRLSPPSQESRPFPINDGDIVQLGIDFKGGEENIFRCVKMRLELNRGWQNKPNPFNMAAHKKLQDLFKSTKAPRSSNSDSQDCSICLNSIAPCQSLFVAQCSHTWHFKCVRSLLMSPQYPIFVCPNCRASADLEADVEQPSEEWERMGEAEVGTMDVDAKDSDASNNDNDNQSDAARAAASDVSEAPSPDADFMDITVSVNTTGSPAAGRQQSGNLPHAPSEPLPIRASTSGSGRVAHLRGDRSPSPSSSGAEGPITPRNNAGPWVFDGSAGRRVADGNGEMRSLDAAADMNTGPGN
ncbi:FHA domain containing protein [Moelleriella libera RCEF 2490]|uniref:RING-type E3 ubiquitin transferase n=1 Tax=Moelleriella libera RCEF 2490 TaxID=1081109 RepID=A0A168AF87_9HYPO|nr:FHA domain containing protein [Moelleriella libera RCEF 2490]